jgi:hypothetical protein
VLLVVICEVEVTEHDHALATHCHDEIKQRNQKRSGLSITGDVADFGEPVAGECVGADDIDPELDHEHRLHQRVGFDFGDDLVDLVVEIVEAKVATDVNADKNVHDGSLCSP